MGQRRSATQRRWTLAAPVGKLLCGRRGQENELCRTLRRLKGVRRTPRGVLRACGALGSVVMQGVMALGAVVSPDAARRFVNRVACPSVQVPRPVAHQTVTIFDWDDTLLCTSWLYARWARRSRSFLGLRRRWRPDTATAADLAIIENHAVELLDQAVKLGPTFVVTNACAEWVHESATMWAPRVIPRLKGVEVISARDSFQKVYPTEMQRRAFVRTIAVGWRCGRVGEAEDEVAR